MKFQVLSWACTELTVFWELAPFCRVELCRRFGGNYCLNHHAYDDGGSRNPCLLRYTAVLSGRSVRTFRECLLSTLSGISNTVCHTGFSIKFLCILVTSHASCMSRDMGHNLNNILESELKKRRELNKTFFFRALPVSSASDLQRHQQNFCF
jgi:hypothetical protein